MFAVYALLCLLFLAALVLLLLRPGAARAASVWGLAALLPVLCALAVALGAQARAAREVRAAPPRGAAVTVTRAGQTQTYALTGIEAACVERAVRLHSKVVLRTGAGDLKLDKDVAVNGTLPDRRIVEALAVRGDLRCPRGRG